MSEKSLENSLSISYIISGSGTYPDGACLEGKKLPFELVLCVAGGGVDATVGGRTVHADDGDAVIVPFDGDFRLEVSPGTSVRFVGADFRIYTSLRVFSLYDTPVLITGDAAGKLRDICSGICASADVTGFTNYRLENAVSLSEQLYRLEGVILNVSTQKLGSEKMLTGFGKLATVFSYIGDNLRRNILMSELSNISGVTPDVFYKLFRTTTGEAPKDFFISERLRGTRLTLLSTDKSIGEISEQAGYSNQLYYSSIFKKKYGICPTEYRKKAIWLSGGEK